MLTLIERLKACAVDPKQAWYRERERAQFHYYAAPEAFVAFPPLSVPQVEHAEQLLGFQLPVLLRELYLQVGNGNFGPGHRGLLPLIPSSGRADYGTVLSTYFWDDRRRWPEQLLAISSWGCGICSCLDCTDPAAPVIRADPNGVSDEAPLMARFAREANSFQEWLEAWLDNHDLFQAPLIRFDPPLH